VKRLRGAIRVASRVVLAAALGALLVVAFFYVYDALTGIYRPYAARQTPHRDHPELGVEWPMHPVDNPGDWLPNGLDPADVNGDGYDDYVTNYEFRGRVRVAFHPGAALDGAAWPAVDAGRVPNAESAALGDLDRDGALDIVVAHGMEHTRQAPGVRVLWGSPGPEARSAGSPGPPGSDGGQAWIDGGDLPASAGGWQFLAVQAVDLDGDGDLDIVAGGRASRMAGRGKEAIYAGDRLVWAGIRWFENPGSGKARELGAWARHDIDAVSRSGHGFELGDLDGDGDLDLANGNADWDTPEAEEAVVWYENPGARAAFAPAWPRHEIYRGHEFYGKEQVVIADLDGDGWNDILTQTARDIYWFRNAGPDGATSSTASFRLVTIPKHPATQWRGRSLEAADLNGDGRLDLVGALIHRDGSLPADKAAVFWMEQMNGGWRSHVIKWGDGFWGLGTFNGEKWDQLVPTDVDGDGDLDLVANCEEYNRLRSILAVVWFENPGGPE
jgi:hypothetical protein